MTKNSKVVEHKKISRQFIDESVTELSIPIRIMHYNVLERRAGSREPEVVGEEFRGYLEGYDVELIMESVIEPDDWSEAIMISLREAAIHSVLESIRIELFSALRNQIVDDS